VRETSLHSDSVKVWAPPYVSASVEHVTGAAVADAGSLSVHALNDAGTAKTITVRR